MHLLTYIFITAFPYRNMLQEAYTKFSQLTELIEICKNAIANK